MTKEEFEGWLSIRPTQEIKNYITELRANREELLHNLCSTCTDTQILAIQASRLMGMITGLNSILEITWEDVGGNDED